eukprot:749688-Hanusia_phi.AAC.2
MLKIRSPVTGTLTVFKVQHSDPAITGGRAREAAKLSTLDTGLSRLRRLSSSQMHTPTAALSVHEC